MAEVWPSLLPSQPLIGGTQILADNRVVSEMDAGPAKVRRRSTAAGGEVNYRFIMDRQQAREFKKFYEEVLLEGEEPFTGLQDRLGNAATYRIKGVPKLQEMGSDIFSLTLDLEEEV